MTKEALLTMDGVVAEVLRNTQRIECAEEYAQFFECVRAARTCGYEPRASWVRGALLAENGAPA